MRTFDQIKAIRAGLLAEGEALLDAADEAGRALNAQEQARFEELTAKVERLNEELDGIVIHPATVEAVVLPPIDTSTWTKATLDEEIEAIRNRFTEVLEG